MLRRALFVTFVAAGCAKDVVLADLETEPVCGNGVLESGEACDLRSPGCVACLIVPTWTCSKTDCKPICGDGVVGSGADCASPRRDSDCDVSGYWAARATDYARDTILGGIQTTSNWYLFRFAQTGDGFRIVEQLDCGAHVTGSATVDATPGTMRGLIYKNRMDGGGARAARNGTSKPSAGGCTMTLDRWYSVRGVVDAFLPADFAAKPPLSSLTPLPSVNDPVNGVENPAGTDDLDGDGIPGAAFAVTGIVTGTRNSAQRDLREYATTTPVLAGALTLALPATYDMQESVIRVTGCGTGCSLVAAAATAARDVAGYLALSFIGKSFGSQRVSQIVTDIPRKNLDADLTTCARVRLLLPHDPSRPASP